MKFGFMAKHRGIWPVGMMCEALGVSRSGFYAWLVRPPCQRRRTDEVLSVQVRQSFLSSDRTYGARRVWHDVLALGLRCGLHRVERLMRKQALRAQLSRLSCQSRSAAKNDARSHAQLTGHRANASLLVPSVHTLVLHFAPCNTSSITGVATTG